VIEERNPTGLNPNAPRGKKTQVENP